MKELKLIFFMVFFYLFLPAVVIYEHDIQNTQEESLDDFGFDDADVTADVNVDETGIFAKIGNYFQKNKYLLEDILSICIYFFLINQYLTGAKPKFLIKLFSNTQGLLKFHIITAGIFIILMLAHGILHFAEGSILEFRHYLLGSIYIIMVVLSYVFWVKTKINPMYKVFAGLNKKITKNKVPFLSNYLSLKAFHKWIGILGLVVVYHHVYLGLNFDNYIWFDRFEGFPKGYTFFIVNIHFFFVAIVYTIIGIKKKKAKK